MCVRGGPPYFLFIYIKGDFHPFCFYIFLDYAKLFVAKYAVEPKVAIVAP
jgi:hypothetical protein